MDQCGFHCHVTRWHFIKLWILSRRSLLQHERNCLSQKKLYDRTSHTIYFIFTITHHMCPNPRLACVSLWCHFVILNHAWPQNRRFPFFDPHNQITQWTHISHTHVHSCTHPVTNLHFVTTPSYHILWHSSQLLMFYARLCHYSPSPFIGTKKYISPCVILK